MQHDGEAWEALKKLWKVLRDLALKPQSTWKLLKILTDPMFLGREIEAVRSFAGVLGGPCQARVRGLGAPRSILQRGKLCPVDLLERSGRAEA